MRRVLRQVITGLVSILLDAILQGSGGGGGGGRRAGAREEGGGGAGRGVGAGACSRAPVRAQAKLSVRERATRGIHCKEWGLAATAHAAQASLRPQASPR